MVNEKKIEVLKGAAERKRQDALRRTDEAINRLVKQGKHITFPSVAEEAGVSVTYLYKYDELKERIEHLRNQQEKKFKKPSNPQPATDNSKAVIVYNFKQEINKLRTENKGLRDQVEMVYGRLHSLKAAEQEAESLRQEVEVLMVENRRMLLENDLLKKRLNEYFIQENEISLPPNIEPVATVMPLREKKTRRSAISDEIKLKLTEVGIELNTTLTKTIKAASDTMVLSAIEALKEAMGNGDIERPGGWLNKAIRDGWIPNEKHLPQQKVERDIFKEWFGLAYKQRLVLASTKGDNDQMYVYNLDYEIIPFEQMLAEYPLEKLRASLLKS